MSVEATATPATTTEASEVPLSVAQEAIWIYWQVAPDDPAYTVCLPLLLEGELEEARLRRAVTRLGELHPALRGRVVTTPQGPSLRWADAPPIPVVERPVTGPAEAAVRERATVPFDLRRGPLLRVETLRGPGYRIVLFAGHHIVLDATACGLLLGELSRLYAGHDLAPPNDAHVLAAFARRQRELSDGPEGEAHRRFWRDHLGPDVPPLLLPAPTDEPGHAVLHRMVDSGLVGRVEEVADELGVHRLVPFYAACCILIGHYTGRSDLVLGTTYHGRRDPLVQDRVGFFANTLPLRHRLSRDLTYREVVQRLHRNLVGATAYGDLPMPVILREAGLGGEAARKSANQVVFGYWAAPPVDVIDILRVPLGAATLRMLPTEDVADYALTVFLREDSAGATVSWRDPGGVVGPEMLARLADDYPVILDRLLAAPDEPLSAPVPALTAYVDRLRGDDPPPLPIQSGTSGFEPPGDLAAAAHKLGVTVEALLLAGVAGVLRRHTAGPRLSVTRPAGPVPMRLEPPPEATFARFARNIHEELAVARDLRLPPPHVLRRLLGDHDPYGAAVVSFGGIEPPGDGPALRFTFDLEGGSGQVPAAFAGHLTRFLASVIADPAQAVDDVEVLSPDERRAQTTGWEDIGHPQVSLPELLRDRMRAAPQAVALTHGREHVTYGDLLERVEALARGLVARGVRPGDLVGLLVRRGIGQVEAILAVLFAGAAYVPIDVTTPAARRAFILADCGAKLLVTDDEQVKPAVTLAELQSAAAALPDISPDAPAYCIYTSGTTGRPKGVLITHRNVVRLIVNDRPPFAFGPDDVWTLFHSYAFDFSVWELFGCLAYGGRLVIVGAEQARDTEQYLALLRAERVTVLNQTPSAFAHLLAVAPEARLDHLRYVIFGGERLRPRALAGFARRHPGVELVNMYGITETTVHVTVHRITEQDIADDRSNIGRPIPTTTVYLLDDRLRLLPAGAVGEICVGGLGVSPGYVNRPELTAERFVPNPFGPGLLYRSGDLARWLPDGALEALGRADGQVKVRGHRIETGEIESCLREHPGVAGAAVLLEGDRLVAYVRPAGERIGAAELREHVRAALPGYMVPAAFHEVAAFPLTVNGKLDRAALRATATPLAATGDTTGTADTAEGTAGEVARLWADLLGVPEPGPGDSFFDLGGHSLHATRVIGAVRERMGVELPLRVLFERPRLGDFARALDEYRADDPEEDDGEWVPPSGIQRQIWLAERVAPDEGLYQVPIVLRVRGDLDPVRLADALARVIARHEVLRTRFAERDGELWQVVGQGWHPEIERHDLRGLTAAARERRVRAIVADGMDPGSGRPLKAALADLGDGEHLLILRLHHLVWDEGSTPVFLRDLRHCHDSPENPAPPAPAAPIAGDTLRRVADVWADLLGVPAPGPDASFFDLGGHSLLGARMLARMRAAFGIKVPLRTLFESPRLGDFAAAIERGLAAPQAPDEVIPDADWLPASGFQERIWFAERLEPDTAVYHVPHTWRISGRLDRDRLAGALAQVIARHEILRTRFAERDGRLWRAAGEPWRPAVEYHDLRALPNGEAEADRLREEAVRTPFTPSSGRPLRVLLLDLPGDEQLLFLCVHHLVWDGQSAPPFLRDLAACYDGRPPAGPPARYDDVVARLAAGREGAGLAYWAGALAGAPPYPDVAPPVPAEPHGAVTVPLRPDLADRLRALQRARGASRFMIFAAALAATLHRRTGRSELTVGTPVALRDDPRARSVVGPCLNSVVLVSRALPSDTLGQLLLRTRDAVLDAVAHHDVPFEAVVERLNPPRRPGWTPYLDVTLNLNTVPAEWPAIGGLKTTAEPMDWIWRHEQKFGLTFTVTDRGDRLAAVLSYRGDRYRRTEAEWLAGALGRTLDAFGDLLDRPLERIEPDTVRQAPPAARYRDFVAAEAAARDDAAGLGHWARVLDGAPAYLDLATPVAPAPHGTVPVELPPRLADRLRDLAATRAVTPFQVLAAALAAALHAWTGRPDVTFGTPMANRDREEFADLVGPLLNTAVVRSRRTADTTLGGLLTAVRDALLDAHEHAAVPFEAVVDRLNPPRLPGRTPYVDAMLSVETGQPPVRLGAARLELDTGHEDAAVSAKFPLTVHFRQEGGHFTGRVAYRGDQVAAADAATLAGLVGRLVRRFTEDLDRPLSASVLLDAPERARLGMFEHGPRPAPPTTVPALLAEQIARRPDAPVIGSLTYRELDERARALAGRLRPLVRGPLPVAVLHAPRGADFVVGMLAAWYAGCAFCPIDPDHPDERAAYVLRDTGAVALLTAGSPPGTDVPVLDIAADERPAGAFEPVTPDPAAPAYVIYTSGSTGTPKGVVVGHGNLAHLVRWYIDAFDVGPDDRGAHLSSVGFDASQWEVWPYLAAGARVVPHERPVVISDVAGWLAEREITVCFLSTPLAEVVWADPVPLPALRWMLYGAAPLTRRPPADLTYEVCNNYGPTECTVAVASLPGPPPADGPLNVVGRPITGASIHVLDESGGRCPAGVPGEIHIGGDGVALGYLGRPELTEERFVRDARTGERIYRTGDRGRWLPDGTLAYLGRLDRQLKVRGHRVEPREVEAHLLADPLVGRAFVTGDATRLLAYLVPAQSDPDGRAVLARLAGRVPRHLVPDRVVWLDDLPTTPNGKVDVDRLPAPAREPEGTVAEPDTDLERRVARIWAAVLDLDRVGVEDNFFDAGGNSMLLARLHARLQEELDAGLSMRLLFQYPTVRSFAQAYAGAAPPARDHDDGSIRDRAARARRYRTTRPRRDAER
ncbi:hypothetical protein DP939_07355 [Spongiactinospora rosea]|uniref:Carrier domain-containing protein n=1 Tax=Spongiactinospora rosea TaxID=2248750 RepID=A0A366M3U7_9ACTN|nr:non-ribosomal peptide synthetase [Spongiactinospora rosea]RBQ20876.1 hypothetical protein DP939_07355 [Spongiactinospora rosea]